MAKDRRKIFNSQRVERRDWWPLWHSKGLDFYEMTNRAILLRGGDAAESEYGDSQGWLLIAGKDKEEVLILMKQAESQAGMRSAH